MFDVTSEEIRWALTILDAMAMYAKEGNKQAVVEKKEGVWKYTLIVRPNEPEFSLLEEEGEMLRRIRQFSAKELWQKVLNLSSFRPPWLIRLINSHWEVLLADIGSEFPEYPFRRKIGGDVVVEISRFSD